MMASMMAIDLLDPMWRRKPLTPRAARTFFRCSPRRARGDRCHAHLHKGEGRRVIALERVGHRDVEQQLDEPGEETNVPREGFNLEAYKARRARKELKKAVKTYQRRIRRADLHELSEEERGLMLALEAELRRNAMCELVLLQNPAVLQERVAELEADEEVQDHLVAMELERIEIDVDHLYAA